MSIFCYIGTIYLETRARDHDQNFMYRNTIAGSSPGERIFIYFEKIRFASQKTKFLNFVFQPKKINVNDLKWLRNNKRLQKLIYSIFVILSS